MKTTFLKILKLTQDLGPELSEAGVQVTGNT